MFEALFVRHICVLLLTGASLILKVSSTGKLSRLLHIVRLTDVAGDFNAQTSCIVETKRRTGGQFSVSADWIDNGNCLIEVYSNHRPFLEKPLFVLESDIDSSGTIPRLHSLGLRQTTLSLVTAGCVIRGLPINLVTSRNF